MELQSDFADRNAIKNQFLNLNVFVSIKMLIVHSGKEVMIRQKNRHGPTLTESNGAQIPRQILQNTNFIAIISSMKNGLERKIFIKF